MKRGLISAGQTNGISSTMFAVRRFQPQHHHYHHLPFTPTFNFVAPFHSPSQRTHPFWPDLHRWRDAPHNHARSWGPDASCLADCARIVLSTPDPLAKSRLSHLAFSRWRRHGLPVGISRPPDRPARPSKPVLVSPKEIPSHKELGVPLNAYMLHNLAHVELNAIDLAWDTVVRFSAFGDVLGDDFFWDFARVADDESRHFSWCSQRLAELGFNYGDIPAHNLLWRECEKSAGDVSARLAMIPMVQEARGLDAGPRLVQKLIGFGDHRTSNIVAKIAEEEVAHVAVGVYWFVLVCQKMGRVPSATFKDILKEYNVELKGPFNYTAREEAGIPRDWYDGTITTERKRELAEVHDRLACIVAMEKENSNLNS
ncbi:Ferritin-like protein [Dioscorea alata]|uniref:Ferritin-like protein n=1 Tax=Dioscorea alata TaxID=55571 RepID=A0ACB7UCX2_DIOAL|nr:Ferritin-like protein [Dioscorea alata]